jgi:glycosyltransferase involved in cell wall biosynthesis
LHLCGSGEQKDMIPRDPRIIVENFVQPEELAKRYHAARFFILPSLSEAWGLVVHEAALCGCALILSDEVGSGDDLAGPHNAVRFPAGNHEAIVKALTSAALFGEEQLGKAEAESRAIARIFGPDRFAGEIARLIGDLQSSPAYRKLQTACQTARQE